MSSTFSSELRATASAVDPAETNPWTPALAMKRTEKEEKEEDQPSNFVGRVEKNFHSLCFLWAS